MSRPARAHAMSGPEPAWGAGAGPDGPRAVVVVRDGVVESAHRAVVAVADGRGGPVGGAGDVAEAVYPRSAVKPVQAAACLEVLGGGRGGAGGGAPAGGGAAGGLRVELDAPAVAIGAASHAGTDDHQIEAARLLALAGLDESALACPPAWPLGAAAPPAPSGPPAPPASPGPPGAAVPAGGDGAWAGERTALAHNCSGKHALMLLATVTAGGDPDRYLDPGAPVQAAVRRRLSAVAGEEPAGPGVDGCGAPAWRLSTRALAALAARLAGGGGPGAGDPELARVAAAMRARPELVGGEDAVDTALMRAGADAGVVAKRGAEGVLLAGVPEPPGAAAGGGGGLGVAVKVVDGGARATGPIAAAVLAAAGAAVPAWLRRPPVRGGGEVRGEVALTDALDGVLAGVAGR